LLWAVRGRAPSTSVWLAVLLAFLGAWMLGGGGFGAFSPGDWLVASSTIFWAGHILMTDQAARHDRPLTFTCLQFAIVALLAAPVAILTEPIALSAILAAWDSLLYLGVVSGALTFSLLAVALRYAPTAEATVLMSPSSQHNIDWSDSLGSDG
jgi:drug/metabolite transporter (DMT)-like permease